MLVVYLNVKRKRQQNKILVSFFLSFFLSHKSIICPWNVEVERLNERFIVVGNN